MPGPDPIGLWREWLGRSGVPGPLDRLLAARKAGREVHQALTDAARWAPLVVEAWSGSSEAVLDGLRALAPRDGLAMAAVCAGRPGPRALTERLADTRRRLTRDGSLEARLVLHGIPRGFAPMLERRIERTGPIDAWLEAQTRPAPLWTRPADERVAGELRAEGFRVDAVGAALRVEGRRGITTSGPYASGRLEVQDLGSQRVGESATPRPGQRVWDVCAGRGGKTVLLARALAGRGVVVATDPDPRKLDQLRVRVRRAGVADVVRVVAWDGEAAPAFGREVRDGFDVVLVDAPCSSTGTWRRNPDAKLRLDPVAIPGHADLQRHLVELGRGALRDGGRLVYSTCSIAVEEDEDVAESDGRLWGPPELDSDTLFAALIESSPSAPVWVRTSGTRSGPTS